MKWLVVYAALEAISFIFAAVNTTAGEMDKAIFWLVFVVYWHLRQHTEQTTTPEPRHD